MIRIAMRRLDGAILVPEEHWKVLYAGVEAIHRQFHFLTVAVQNDIEELLETGEA